MAVLFKRRTSRKQSHTKWRPQVERLEDRMLLAGEPQFITPLAGDPYDDWAIAFYLDHDSSPSPTPPVNPFVNFGAGFPLLGTRDYEGRTNVDAYTYDNHEGIDMALPNFAAQDVGVPVYAAASGTVDGAADGFYDRNIDGPNEGCGNSVRIHHGNDWLSEYCHLRKDSTAVAEGQHVEPGQFLGLAGSSGRSILPHLHFDVSHGADSQGRDIHVDPYDAPNTFWQDPLPYAGTVYGALDHGMTGDNPAIASPVPWFEFMSRPVEQTVFKRPDRPTPPPFCGLPGQEPCPPLPVLPIWLWVNLHGIEPQPGDMVQYRWRDPNGFEVIPPRVKPAVEMHFGWDMDTLFIDPNTPRGMWSAEFVYRRWNAARSDFDDQTLANDRFLVTDNPDLLQGDVGFNAGDYHITEKGIATDSGRAVRLKIWRTSPYESVSVSYSTSDDSARAGSDYIATSGTVRFNEGDLVKTIDIPLIDDPCGSEYEESFYVTLSNPTDQASLMFPSVAKVHIYDSADSPFQLNPNTKELFIQGCNGNEDIDVYVEQDGITVTTTLRPELPGAGPARLFTDDFKFRKGNNVLITSIQVDGRGGDDSISLRTAEEGASTKLLVPTRITGGDGNDTLVIRPGRRFGGVQAGIFDLALRGGEGDDAFQLVSNQDGGIFGNFVLDGEGGLDRLTVDDFGITPVPYTLTESAISRGNAFADVPLTNIEDVTLNAGHLADVININGTKAGALTTINAGYGRDQINVRGTAITGQTHIHGGGDPDQITVVEGSVTGLETTIYGDEANDQIEVHWGSPGFFGYIHRAKGLTVNGNDGNDTLVMNDSANPVTNEYLIGSNTASARSSSELFPSVVTYHTTEEVVVTSGGAGSTFFVDSTAAGTPVTIFAGGGNDSVTVGGGDLDMLLAPVTVNGQGGTDSVVLEDSNSGNTDNYVITDSTVAKQPFELTFATVEAVTVEAAPFDNFFHINSTGAPPVSINAGSGNDTFSFANGGRIGGRIDGQDGSDTLDYTLYRTAAEVNRVTGTATGIGGGFANIETVLGATIVSAFNVLDRKSASTVIDSIFAADALLGYASGDARIASETVAGLAVIDFIDPQNAGSFGHFAVNNPFPNNTPADNDDFAVKVTAVIQLPVTGIWTFGTHSDDGLRLRIDGLTIIDDPLPHAALDRFHAGLWIAGYHTLELEYFERGGGANVELFAAPGSHSSFNENFRLIGDAANGGLNVFATTGFSVRDVKKTIPAVNSLTDADALLALRPGDPGIASERSAIVPVIDLVDPQNSSGGVHFAINRPFPNDSPADDGHFAVRADAFIYIPIADDWTFGANSDDGVRLRIGSNTVLDYPQPQGPTDRLGTVSLSKGFHPLNLVFFEQGGWAELELFAARGSHTSFNGNFRLVGDTVNGGLLALAASNCLTVTNTLDGGPGSLRDAIGCANILPGHDTISFAIPGGGVHTIRPLSPLPSIGDSVVIDGYSEPGARPNSLSAGTDAVLRIELDGTNAGPAASGLTLGASDSTVRGLVINRFNGHGVEVAFSRRNVIQGNYIGTDATGTLDMGNGGDGIAVNAGFLAADQNRIGGLSPSDRNVVSGNNQSGVAITGAGNIVQGNYIGTDATGRLAVGNTGDGVELNLAHGAVIGTGLFTGRNVISGNGGDGIRINGGSGPLAQPVSRWTGDGHPFDFVGLNSGALLGGATYASGQFNQAFDLDGVDDLVEIPDSPRHTTRALTLEAWVRPDKLGTHRTIASKYDSRFTGGNSWALQATPDGKVELIAYQTYIANGPIVFRHIQTLEPLLSVGAWRHVAASFDVATQQMEIYIDGARTASTLMPGSQPLASIVDSNTPMRLGAIFASGTFVGLTQFWDGLLDEVGLYNRALSASQVQALYRRNVGAHQITANFIGTDANGTAPLGNAGDGISIINSTGNMIGGMLPLFANIIAHNGAVGVVVESGAGNAILTNRVYSNTVLGIDLAGNMVTPNDPMDADGGANTLQNFPVVQSAVIKPNRLDVSGVMSGRASQPYTLQFFASATCDPSGNGQGVTVVGIADVTTAAAGSTPFAASIPTFGPIARFITATATDAVGNTSEFSTCHGAVPEIAGDINADGAVNLLDIVIQQGRLGQATNQGVFGGDLDGDGLVSRSDVARLMPSYGSSAQPPSPIAADAAIAQLLDRDPGVNRRPLRSRRALSVVTAVTSTELAPVPTLTAQRVSSKLRSQRLIRS